jgi:hypothetical protein
LRLVVYFSRISVAPNPDEVGRNRQTPASKLPITE